MRVTFALVLAAMACRERESSRVAAPAAESSASALPAGTDRGAARAAFADAQLAALLRDTGAHGAVVVTDVASGATIASAAVGREASGPVMALSVIKLYVAALWWEHEMGDGDFVVRGRHVTATDMLVDGWDHPGEEMAIELRKKLGGAAMLAALRGYGLGYGFTLPADADDARWGSALSIGEHDVMVTLPIVASFLRAIGGGTPLLRPETRQHMQAAMRGAVERGTAKSAGARLAGQAGAAGQGSAVPTVQGWQLGGKTGSGPFGAEPFDGWFAGLIFERGVPRYAIAVYIERRGLGGGVAAGLAADVTRLLSGP